MKLALLLFCALCLPFPAWAWTGIVLRVKDGDSVTLAPVDQDRGIKTIRLYGIDAPELGQAFGRRAARFLADRLPAGTRVEVDALYVDPYDREVAVLRANGATLNAELIRVGLAWVYSRFCKASFCGEWRELEKSARKGRLGLWRDGKPIPPWTWRRKHPRRS